MFDAQVIQAMVASPGDVKVERQIFIDVVREWNSLNARLRNFIILPVAWEMDVAAEFRGQSGQENINEDIVDNSDIMIAIFSTRIGTPTKVAPGGSVEEVERHLKSNKIALMFFSMAPIERESFDVEQHSKLNEFKKWCQDKGIYESFASPAEFREKLLRSLTHSINRRFLNSPGLGHRVLGGKISRAGSHISASLRAAVKKQLILKTDEGKAQLVIDGVDIAELYEPMTNDEWIDTLKALIKSAAIRDLTGRGEVFVPA